MRKLEELKKIIYPENKLIIFGAQNHARGMYEALKICAPEIKVLFFLVSARKNNPEYIDEIAVKTIDGTSEEDTHVPVMVATPDVYFDEIVETLHRHNFHHIFDGTFGGDFDNEMRIVYYKNHFIDDGRNFEMFSDLTPSKENEDECINCNLMMYMAKSVFDRPLKKIYELPDYICMVQAGAALTDQIIAEKRDDVGKNISKKNRNYCECTVSYYIRQQAKEDYVGLCHYRRRFQWKEEDLQIIRRGQVDVILPYPVITKIYEIHYRPYIDEDVFQTMLSVLKREWPEYYVAATDVLKGDVFYPCNMLMAKNEVFAAYADWMFAVLTKVEEICGDETVRTDRYLGYLAEHLTTFYFVRNRDKLRIVHSRMEILK